MREFTHKYTHTHTHTDTHTDTHTQIHRHKTHIHVLLIIRASRQNESAPGDLFREFDEE